MGMIEYWVSSDANLPATLLLAIRAVGGTVVESLPSNDELASLHHPKAFRELYANKLHASYLFLSGAETTCFIARPSDWGFIFVKPMPRHFQEEIPSLDPRPFIARWGQGAHVIIVRASRRYLERELVRVASFAPFNP